MKKYVNIVLTGIITLVIGFILTTQLLLAEGDNMIGLASLDELKPYENQLKEVKKEKQERRQELFVLEQQVEDMENGQLAEDQFMKDLTSSLEQNKIASGMLDVHGSGVEITIQVPKKAVYDLEGLKGNELPTEGGLKEEEEKPQQQHYYTAEAILSLINELKDAGAEAIAINGQRIMAMTVITSNEENLDIDKNTFSSPFLVEAIGDPIKLESTLNLRAGIVETMEKSGLEVSIVKKKDIILNRSSEPMKFRYARPIN